MLKVSERHIILWMKLSGEAQPNNSFNRSANSIVFIENLALSAVRRARLIRALERLKPQPESSGACSVPRQRRSNISLKPTASQPAFHPLTRRLVPSDARRLSSGVRSPGSGAMRLRACHRAAEGRSNISLNRTRYQLECRRELGRSRRCLPRRLIRALDGC